MLTNLLNLVGYGASLGRTDAADHPGQIDVPKARPAPVGGALERTAGQLVRDGNPHASFGVPRFSTEWIDSAAFAGVVATGVKLSTMPRVAVDATLQNRREAMTALFTGACMETHEALKSVVTDVRAARRLKRLMPNVKISSRTDRDKDAQLFGNSRTVRASIAAGCMERVPTGHSGTDPQFLFPTVEHAHGAMLRVPTGEYGPRLAKAMVLAAQTMIGAAKDIQPQPEWAKPYLQRLVFQSRADHVLRAAIAEGAASMANAMGLLLGKRVPGMTVEQALDAAIRPMLLLARHVPFGVIAPLANNLYVPKHAMPIDRKGHAGIPEDLMTVIRREAEARFVPAAGEQAPKGALVINSNETLRGCPVAYAGPVAGADGKLTLHVGLQALAEDFVALTKLYLEDLGGSP